MIRINPFRPHSPQNPGMFVGRLTELRKLEQALLQTRAGQPINFMLTGERGIGKTSLLDYLRSKAQGGIPVEGENLSFLVVETDIDPKTTQLGLVKKIELGLRRELGKTETARTFLSEAWDFLKRVEAGGFALKEGPGSDSDIVVEEFAYSLAETVNRLTQTKTFSTQRNGLVILIDEADNSSGELQIGSFLKLLLERLQRNDCNNVMIGLAGLPELPRVLSDSHPSSLRQFAELPLARLSDDEVKSAIRICLRRANADNTVPVSINEEAEQALVNLSEGYPHFIQQFGYCAYEANADDTIDISDVINGAFGKGGGLETIGDTYYRNDFYNKIQKESYRQVLRIMADKHDGWVTKAEIKAKFTGKVGILDNALHALRERNIIFSREGHRGVYRLQHRGFALWIKLHTSDKHRTETANLAGLSTESES